MRPYFMATADAKAQPPALPAGPRKFFSRFDADFLGISEIDDEEGPDDSSIHIDVIQANWAGFREGVFALEANGTRGSGPALAYWRQIFTGDIEGLADAFGEIGLASLRLPRELASEWLRIRGDSWFELQLAPTEAPSPDAFLALGLFSDTELGVRATLTEAVLPDATQAALDNIFDMASWPTSTDRQLRAAFAKAHATAQMIALDVGQGSSTAFTSSSGTPQFYLDTGAGINPNAATTPANLKFCVCESPPVILSHWDADHWSGALHDPVLMHRAWIVPRQKRVKPSHIVFGNDILLAKGRLRVLNPGTRLRIDLGPTYQWIRNRFTTQQTIELVSCTGTTMNDSGLAVYVADHDRKLSWLATGDASYDHIPPPSDDYHLAGLTASHHGARQPRKRIVAPQRRLRGYARILYSFGANNRFAGKTSVHPTADSIHLHTRSGWMAGTGLGQNGNDPSGGDTLTTAFHAFTQVRGPIAVGWRRRPQQPRHLSTCLSNFQVRT